MAYEIPDFLVGIFPADIDMSTESTFLYTGVCVYPAVSVTGYGVGGAALIPPSGATTPIIGVLQNNPQQGEAGSVMVQGVTKALAGGNFNIGDILESNSSGLLVKATTGNFGVAQALEVGSNGIYVAVLLIRNGKQ
jgi:Uncharacterized conserved protein (DUF2190)